MKANVSKQSSKATHNVFSDRSKTENVAAGMSLSVGWGGGDGKQGISKKAINEMR